MAQMVGADLAELESLARAFDAAAAQLTSLAGRVRQGIQVSAWVGHVAQRFRVDWSSQHSRALLRTADELRQAARHVRHQAERQRQASASSSGASGGGVAGGADAHAQSSQASSSSPDIFTLASVVGAGIGLGANSSLIGRYNKLDPFAWTKYKKDLNGMFKVNGPWHKISRIPGLNKLTTFAGLVDLYRKRESFEANPTLGGGVDLLAGGLKALPNPVTYLAGMAVSSVKLAVDAGAQADFSADGFKTVVEAVQRDGAEEILIGGAAPALEKFLTKDIWTIF